jgi:hypothetical protein
MKWRCGARAVAYTSPAAVLFHLLGLSPSDIVFALGRRGLPFGHAFAATTLVHWTAQHGLG